MLNRSAIAAALFAGVSAAQTGRILYVTHSAGFVHGSIPVSERALDEIARRTGRLEVVPTQDLSLISAEGLRGFDAVFFFTSGELALSAGQKQALLDFVRNGKGFGGAHSATDTLYQWPEYGDLIGGYFDGHPWVHEAGVDVEDPDHPATRGLGNSFRILEEFYQFRAWSRDRLRVLLTLDTNTINLRAEGVNRTDNDFALAWCRSYGSGRVFYTALGHFDETWRDARFQRLLEGALLWMAGQRPAGAGEGLPSQADCSPRRSTPVPARVSNLAFETDLVAAPGMLAAITGAGLTTGSRAAATGLPLPRKLAGTEVRVNGAAAALVSVAPDRIVVQFPEDPRPGEEAEVTVVSGVVQPSTPMKLRVEPSVPGILGAIRILNVLSLYVTGLGRETAVDVLVGGRNSEVLFSGNAPGLSGITQINAAVPAGTGQAYEIQVRSSGRASNVIAGPPEN